MRVTATSLPEVKLIEPQVWRDPRGYFMEAWHQRRYLQEGLPATFVQDNLSFSSRGTLRGLHLQHPHGQGKLVYVLAGEVFDVAVDVRIGSPAFGRWVGVVLSADNHRQIYVPPGFAHAFCVLSDTALFLYKCTAFYEPSAEVGIRWDDPDIGIDWPVRAPLLSEKDARHPALRAVAPERLPPYGGA
jgi:dTDP-4-dehydrorhamnose 3,5-epimerase